MEIYDYRCEDCIKKDKIINGLLEACKAALSYLGTSSKLDWDNTLSPKLEKAIEKAEGE